MYPIVYIFNYMYIFTLSKTYVNGVKTNTVLRIQKQGTEIKSELNTLVLVMCIKDFQQELFLWQQEKLTLQHGTDFL